MQQKIIAPLLSNILLLNFKSVIQIIQQLLITNLFCTNRTTAHAVSTAAEQGLTDFKNPYKTRINAVSQGSLGFNCTKYTAGETKIDNTTSEVEDLIYLKDKNLLLINGGIGFVVDSGTQPAQELIVN